MVETNLTKEMIEMGKVLVRKLDEHGVSPDAAFWLYFPKNNNGNSLLQSLASVR